MNTAKAAQSKFLERHRDNIDATTKVFRTVYECAKSHLSYSEHGRMVKLQSLVSNNICQTSRTNGVIKFTCCPVIDTAESVKPVNILGL